MSDLVVIRIRGAVQADVRAERALEVLKLHRVNYATVIPDNPTSRGMIGKVKDFVTWGEINEENKAELAKKGKQFVRLHPPRGGHRRKGIKKHYNVGGALGDRKEHINDLLRQML